jgi:hypothetical protein
MWREVVRIARNDLEHVANAIVELEPAVESDAGEARDAYYRAVGLHARAETELRAARVLADVRGVAARANDARYAIHCARAWLAGREPDPEMGPCFFDPAHGPATRSVVFAPDGGAMQSLRGCAACAEEFDAGRVPPGRRVIVDGRSQPYWRSPAHCGYYGRGGETIDDLVEIAVTLVAIEAGAELAVGALGLLIDGLLS